MFWSCLICGGPLDGIARTPSNEIILSAHNVRCFLSDITKRYKGRPASYWCYLLSHSTMLGFLSLWAWPWYVNGALWNKVYGLVWRTCLVLTLVFWSCLIYGGPLDGLVWSVVIRIEYIWIRRKVPQLKSGKTYEEIAKEILIYIYCKDSLHEWLQVRTETRWLWNVTVGRTRTSLIIHEISQMSHIIMISISLAMRQ